MGLDTLVSREQVHLSRRLNSLCCSLAGSEFRAIGPATEKARRPFIIHVEPETRYGK